VSLALLGELVAAFPADLLRTADGERARYETDHRNRYHGRALAIALPRTVDDVSRLLAWCNQRGVGVVPQGGNTSYCGGATPDASGTQLVVSLERLDRVRSVDAADLSLTVEAGCLLADVQSAAAEAGCFFPLALGSAGSCQIGGNLATNAGGLNVLRFGMTRALVLGVEAVLADGRVYERLRSLRKDNTGYDLCSLLVGSEGTLGVITELTLKLSGIPEAISGGVCPFPSVEAACNAAIATIQSGIPVARIELLDDVQMDAVNKFSKLTYAVKDTLFVEFHGTEAGVKEQAEMVQSIAAEHGGGEFKWATRQEERTHLWQARHDVTYANKALRPGCEIWATDVCVPISRLAECILETKKDLKQSFLIAPLVGHVGDGNFHLGFLIDRDQPEELAEAERLNERLVMRALAMDGTCTGEHGIGLGKQKFLIAEHGEAVSVMRSIKQALDPLNILNPGKIFTL